MTHATDRSLWALRLPWLTEEQQLVARKWLDVIDEECKKLVSTVDGGGRGDDEVFVLNTDKVIKQEREGREARERLAVIARALTGTG